MTQETITQKAYVIGVNKTNILQDLFRSFYIVLNKHTNSYATQDKFWFPSFPSFVLQDTEEARLKYPIGVMELTFNEDRLTISRNLISGTLTLTVLTTSQQTKDAIVQDVFNAIDTERGNLWKIGIKKIKINNMSDDHFVRSSELQIHSKTIEYTFQYVYDKEIY